MSKHKSNSKQETDTKKVAEVEKVIPTVLQLLQYGKFDKTLTTFNAECLSRKLKISKLTNTSSTLDVVTKERLLKRFDAGDCDGFFDVWSVAFSSKHLASAINKFVEQVRVLEFYLHVYFATCFLRATSKHGRTATTSTAKQQPTKESAMGRLKAYLESSTGGARLSKTAELVPYFALPYVAQLHSHPLFKDLTQDKWARTIRDRLTKVLSLATENRTSTTNDIGSNHKSISTPNLLRIIEKGENEDSRSSSKEQNTKDSKRNDEVNLKLQKAEEKSELHKKQARQLQKDYHSLIGIAAELVDALENTIQGKAIKTDYLADISSRLLQSNEKAQEHMKSENGDAQDSLQETQDSGENHRIVAAKSKPTSPRKQNELPPPSPRKQPESRTETRKNRSKSRSDRRRQRMNGDRSGDRHSKQDGPSPTNDSDTLQHKSSSVDSSSRSPEKQISAEILVLNYGKIRSQIMLHSASRETALLLQALRKVLTTNRSDYRNSMFGRYIEKDVLGMKSKKSKGCVATVLICDLKDSKESLARFINTLASVRSGRSYLLTVSNGKHLLTQLTSAVKSRKLGDQASAHVMATLQKLSLRKKVQAELIRLGFIEWLIAFLTGQAKQHTSDMQFEYGTALLMNLTLNNAGKQVAARNADVMVKLLLLLLEHKNKEIRTYVNGILYSVLSLTRIRNKAKELGLDVLIKAAIENPKVPEDKEQLPFVLKQLNGEISTKDQKDQQTSDEEASGNDDDEDEEEDDFLERELESHDKLQPKEGELSGESLLRQRYLLESDQLISSDNNEGDRLSATSKQPLNNSDDERAPPGTVPQSTNTSARFNRNSLLRSTFVVGTAGDKATTTGKHLRPSGRGYASTTAQQKSTITLRGRGVTKTTTNSKATTESINSPKWKEAPPTATRPDTAVVDRKQTADHMKLPVAPSPVTDNSQGMAEIRPILSTKPSVPAVDVETNQQSNAVPRNTTKSKESEQLLSPKRRAKVQQKLNREGSDVSNSVSAPKQSISALIPPVQPQAKAAPKSIQYDIPAVSPGTGGVAPVLGRLQTRVPDDANPSEYLAAFGQRPKVTRTPDNENLKRRGKPAPNMMLFY